MTAVQAVLGGEGSISLFYPLSPALEFAACRCCRDRFDREPKGLHIMLRLPPCLYTSPNRVCSVFALNRRGIADR